MEGGGGFKRCLAARAACPQHVSHFDVSFHPSPLTDTPHPLPPRVALFRCERCHAEAVAPIQPGQQVVEPTRCEHCTATASMRLMPNRCSYVNRQVGGGGRSGACGGFLIERGGRLTKGNG
jgi:hypothetical protein